MLEAKTEMKTVTYLFVRMNCECLFDFLSIYSLVLFNRYVNLTLFDPIEKRNKYFNITWSAMIFILI